MYLPLEIWEVTRNKSVSKFKVKWVDDTYYTPKVSMIFDDRYRSLYRRVHRVAIDLAMVAAHKETQGVCEMVSNISGLLKRRKSV